MLNDIRHRAKGIERMANAYEDHMLIAFDPGWPLEQVNKLLVTLNENRQGWCQVLFEYILHVISTRNTERQAVYASAPETSPPTNQQ